MTTVAIHQPQYLPWLPYLAKASSCDVFVYLDNVQYQQGGVQNRNQIKTASGAAWLTVPVHASLESTICEARIDNTRAWRQKHLASIQQAYTRAPYKALLSCGLRQLLEQDWEFLSELNIAITEWMFEQFGVKCQRIRASLLHVDAVKDDLVIDICKRLNATTYLSGHGAKAYQDERKFDAADVKLRYLDYLHPSYSQCHAKQGFVTGLSALDCLLNMGSAAAPLILTGNISGANACT